MEESSNKTGKYKPSKKFISFEANSKDVKFHSNYAFIKGDNLSGLLDGSLFKITIYKDGTIDFDEIEKKQSNPEMIKRIIEDICNTPTRPYFESFVVTDMNFYTENLSRCFLEVENKKPINKLFDLFSDDSPQEKTDSYDNEEVISEVKENVPRETLPDEDSVYKKMAETSSVEMKEKKINELKNRKTNLEKDIVNLKSMMGSNKYKLNEYIKSLRVIDSRLESFNAKDELIGYVYFVSEHNESNPIKLDELTLKILNKLSSLLGIETELLTKLMTSGTYTIKISKKSEIFNSEKTIEPEIISKITNIDFNGTFIPTKNSNDSVEYIGELNFHEILDKMGCLGFEKNPDFDKICGSNSYQSTIKTHKKDEEKINI